MSNEQKSSYTPGPWHLGMDDDGKFFALAGGNESLTKSIMIARFDGGSNNGRSVEEANANAHLMKAAPDLLEALESMLTFHHGPRGSRSYGYNAALKAEAAIANAKGES